MALWDWTVSQSGTLHSHQGQLNYSFDRLVATRMGMPAASFFPQTLAQMQYSDGLQK